VSRQKNEDQVGSVEGRYANYFEIGFNGFEFLLDFGQFYREKDKPTIHTRIITGPVYGWALYRTLEDVIARYESQFGPIPKASDHEETEQEPTG